MKFMNHHSQPQKIIGFIVGFCLFVATFLGFSNVHAQWGDRPPPPPPPPTGRPNDSHGPSLNTTDLRTTGSVALVGEVWVDNWFRLYVNGKLLIEDSVPITTERSFNAERFHFNVDPPVTLAVEFRDFMQNATGLEYIGTPRQQMGDGGAIAQFRDAHSGRIIAVTDTTWRCLVVQQAPLDDACVHKTNPTVDSSTCAQRLAPMADNWMAPKFDDSNWPFASVHSSMEVGPKGGFRRIDWDRSARFIWGPDLKRDNVVRCRITIPTL